MGDLTTYTRPGALPTALKPPAMPRVVQAAVEQYLAPEVHAGPRVRVLASDLRERMTREAEDIRARSEPASRSLIETWLLPLSMSVVNPPKEKDCIARAWGIAAVAGKIPAWAWNQNALSAAIRKFKFWPSIAELVALVEDLARPTLDAARAMEVLGAAKDETHEPIKPRLPPTAEEKAYVQDLVRGLKAELAERAQAFTRDPERRRSWATLSHQQLETLRAEDPLVQAARAMACEMAAEGTVALRPRKHRATHCAPILQ
jgi:hypothetical protein